MIKNIHAAESELQVIMSSPADGLTVMDAFMIARQLQNAKNALDKVKHILNVRKFGYPAKS
jgi:hypothetical protein